LAGIASILRNKGHEIKLIDMNAMEMETSPVVHETEYLIITSSPMDRWETPYLDLTNAYKVIKTYKDIGAKIILTGPHGTLTPDEIFSKSKDIDIILRGETEETVSELFEHLDDLKTVKGLSYRDKGKIAHNEDRELIKDLDVLPLPAYDLLPMDKYNYNVNEDLLPSPFTIVETSRGCPYNCIFCLKVMHGGRKYRVKSPEKVIEELKYLQDKFQIKSVYFQDLEFTIDKDRVRKICDLMAKKGIKLNWACAARVNDMDDSLVEIMAKAGCKSISFGVESLSRKILNNIQKGTTPEMIANAYEICRKHGVNPNSFYTQGHYGETKATMTESLKNAYKFNIPHPLNRGAEIIPYPGTQLFEMGKKEGVIKEGTWDEIKQLRGKIGTEPDYKKTTLKALSYFILAKIKRYAKKA